MTTPSSGTEGELSLTISPYGHIEWRGPRAKLQSLGVVPTTIKWPERINYAHWHANGSDFTLRRCRPDGLNGPMRGWTHCDCWCLKHFLPLPISQRWALYGPHLELGAVLARAARCGEAISLRFPAPRANRRIERLKARLLPALP